MNCSDIFETKYEEVKKLPSEAQVDGSHYLGLKIKPREYAIKNNLNIDQYSVTKYITRYNRKWKTLEEMIIDLEKAKHHIDLIIEDLKNEQRNI